MWHGHVSCVYNAYRCFAGSVARSRVLGICTCVCCRYINQSVDIGEKLRLELLKKAY